MIGTGRRNLNSWFKWTEALKRGRLNVTETLRIQNATGVAQPTLFFDDTANCASTR
jgi:hypothetical protein